MQIEDILKVFIIALLVGAIAAIFFVIGNGVFQSQEKYECQKWKQEAEKYPTYYLTEWQKAQCDHYGIEIDAPVQDLIY